MIPTRKEPSCRTLVSGNGGMALPVVAELELFALLLGVVDDAKS